MFFSPVYDPEKKHIKVVRGVTCWDMQHTIKTFGTLTVIVVKKRRKKKKQKKREKKENPPKKGGKVVVFPIVGFLNIVFSVLYDPCKKKTCTKNQKPKNKNNKENPPKGGMGMGMEMGVLYLGVYLLCYTFTGSFLPSIGTPTFLFCLCPWWAAQDRCWCSAVQSRTWWGAPAQPGNSRIMSVQDHTYPYALAVGNGQLRVCRVLHPHARMDVPRAQLACRCGCAACSTRMPL